MQQEKISVWLEEWARLRGQRKIPAQEVMRDTTLILAGLLWLQAGKLILGYKQVA